ncbi:MAG: hypothetical protein AAGA10_18575 [Bacteroidota bacterium]
MQKRWINKGRQEFKPVQAVLVKEFYRRNTLFFGLIIIVLFIVMRPAYLIFSPVIVLAILETPIALAVIFGCFFLYFAKSLWETVIAFRKSENVFLYSLISLPPRKAYFLLFRQFHLILAPASLYMLVMCFYGVKEAYWTVFLYAIAWVLLSFLGTFFLIKNLRYPRERVSGFPFQSFIEKNWEQSWTYLGLSNVLKTYYKKILFHKGVILFFTGGLMTYHLTSPLSQKGLRLSLWAIACFQTILSYRFRQSEARPLFILRSLPVSRVKRWGAYVLAGLLLFLPETILACSLSPTLSTLGQVGSYWEICVCVFCLGIAVLHYDAPELSTYLGWSFGLFCVGFVAVLFNLPLWAMGVPIFLFATWIFWDEYYTSEVNFDD